MRAADCDRCALTPCVCGYIARLTSGGTLAHLLPVAVAQSRLPSPHRDACPCPRCYAKRLATFDEVVT
jgi:hypothetical protein